MRTRPSCAALIAISLLTLAPTRAESLELDVGIKTGAAVVSSPSLLGYGGGFGAGASLVLFSPFRRASLGVGADVQLIFGFGPTVAIGVGPFLRYTISSWRPELGAYFQYIGGALVRVADAEGRMPGDPVAFQLGLAPLRFATGTKRAWVSFLATRYGWTFKEGGSSTVLTISAVEVGWTF